MLLNKREVIELYRKRAKNYDWTANLYYLAGFREKAFREKAVAALNLQEGDTVVEIGCGTGLNFPHLHKAVGDAGQLIGVDMTDAMLNEARERCKREAMSNVELVQSDAAAFDFPDGISGIISTLAITLVPEYDEVIKRGAEALKPGGKFVLMELKDAGWPWWLTRIGIWLMQPFGVTWEARHRHPWESLERHLNLVSMKEYYFGIVYIAVGEK